MDIWDVPLIPVWDLYILSEYGHLRCTTHTSLRPVHTFRGVDSIKLFPEDDDNNMANMKTKQAKGTLSLIFFFFFFGGGGGGGLFGDYLRQDC